MTSDVPDRSGEGALAERIGIMYCERIEDASCVGCAKCYKAVNENTFVFADAGDVQVAFETGCGDCPGWWSRGSICR
jgi:MinD superfamily P-loop ATPase